MKVGITGHQDLAKYGDLRWVTAEIQSVVDSLADPFVGLSSLARGADQMFARAVLRREGELRVVTPFNGYDTRFGSTLERRDYADLYKAASSHVTLEWQGSDQLSYRAAGHYIVDQVDLLVAVWDGLPAAGTGGTADVVSYARLRGRPVHHINPRTHEVTPAS